MSSDLEAKRLAVLQSLRKTVQKPFHITTASDTNPSLNIQQANSALTIPQQIGPANGAHQSNDAREQVKPAIAAQPPPPPLFPPPPPPRATAPIHVSPVNGPSKTNVSNPVFNAAPSIALSGGKSPLDRALSDLIRLGYTFSDIVEKAQVKSEVLSVAFQKLGYPVPVKSSELSSVGSPNSHHRNNLVNPLSPTPLTPTILSGATKTPQTQAALLGASPRFGSDRWSKSLSITVSDDEEIEESESDEESEPAIDTPMPTPVVEIKEVVANNAPTTERKDIAQTLEAQREKIRQVAAKLKQLQQQKVEREKIKQSIGQKNEAPIPPDIKWIPIAGNSSQTTVTNNEPVNSIPAAPAQESKTEQLKRKLNALKAKTTQIFSSPQEANNSTAFHETPLHSSAASREPKPPTKSQHHSTSQPIHQPITSHDPQTPENFQEIPRSLVVSTANGSQEHAPTDLRVFSLTKSLEHARQEQELVSNQRKTLEEKLEKLDTNNTKRQIEDLKRELERKMNDLLEQTYEIATAKASFEATKAQEERLLRGISSLEEQLTIEQASAANDPPVTSPISEQLRLHYEVDQSKQPSLESEAPKLEGTLESPPVVHRAPPIASVQQGSAGTVSDSDVEIIDVEPHTNGKVQPTIYSLLRHVFALSNHQL